MVNPLFDSEIERKLRAETTPGSCGSCTLCCTVMKVTFDDGSIKEEGVRCEHLCNDKAGCSIYENRPQTCRGFECLWLASQRWPELAWPNHERPDRTGVVMEVNSKNATIVHCKTPQGWRSDKVRKRIDWLNQRSSAVIIEHGNGECSLLEHDGTASPMEFIGLDPVSNERKFVRRRK